MVLAKQAEVGLDSTKSVGLLPKLPSLLLCMFVMARLHTVAIGLHACRSLWALVFEDDFAMSLVLPNSGGICTNHLEDTGFDGMRPQV